MTDRGVIESVVEQAALVWLEHLGWFVNSGAVIDLKAQPPTFVSGELRLKNAEKFVQEAIA
jgi:hypothetical protein